MIDDLLAQLSLDEKLAQLGCLMVTELMSPDGTLDEAKLAEKLSNGIGEVGRAGALSGQGAEGTAALVADIQTFLRENTPHGIPALFHDECAAGLMAVDATTFPHPVGLGATFEPELVEALTGVVREQMLAIGVRHGLAPVLDVARDPRWGRAEETFGEDTFLTTQMGLAYVKGLQGDDLTEGVAATAKHFLGHGQPQGGRNWAPSPVTKRDLLEHHLPPFRAVIKEAGLASVMNAYHDLDGVPCGASKYLLTDLLREELGFDGAVVSDYHTVKTLEDYHFVAESRADAAAQALSAGIDVELPKLDYYCDLKEALDQNLIEEADIDRAVSRVLTLKERLGLFNLPSSIFNLSSFNPPDQRALARQVAQKSIVLLKNDGVLPLEPSLKRVAVIGPAADSVRHLQGDYHFPSHLEDVIRSQRVSSDSPNPQGAAFDQPVEAYFSKACSSVLDGIRAAVGEGAKVVYAQGCETNSEDSGNIPEAVEAAKNADVAVVVVGERSGLSADSTSGESRDRTRLDLLGKQQELVEAVHATGTPVVVVLATGRPLTLPWIAENCAAVICAWLPAQEGGHAVTDVLFGAVNPAGRLCMTFPRHVGQVPLHYSLTYAGTRSHWQTDYVDESVQPLYPFGHGLSYSSFAYENLELSQSEIDVQGSLAVSLDVTNTSDIAGEEVVQLYVRDMVASVTRPVKLLKGFKRVGFRAGQTKRLTFTLDANHLALYDREMNHVVEPGEVKVMVGASSADIRLNATFQLTGEVAAASHVFTTPVTVGTV